VNSIVTVAEGEELVKRYGWDSH